jgi:hypothetical protein
VVDVLWTHGGTLYDVSADGILIESHNKLTIEVAAIRLFDRDSSLVGALRPVAERRGLMVAQMLSRDNSNSAADKSAHQLKLKLVRSIKGGGVVGGGSNLGAGESV